MIKPEFAFCRLASAALRRSTAAVSAMGAPSMSKSIIFTLYLLITAWYCACAADALLQACPISIPAAPPKEMITFPPELRNALISGPTVVSLPTGTPNPPQPALHPPLSIMKARVKSLIPEAREIEARLLFERLISIYGANKRFPVGGGGTGVGVGLGVGVGTGVGVGFGVGVGLGVPLTGFHSAGVFGGSQPTSEVCA